MARIESPLESLEASNRPGPAPRSGGQEKKGEGDTADLQVGRRCRAGEGKQESEMWLEAGRVLEPVSEPLVCSAQASCLGGHARPSTVVSGCGGGRRSRRGSTRRHASRNRAPRPAQSGRAWNVTHGTSVQYRHNRRSN